MKPGDTIKAEQSLVTVESDKASMEIPSSHAGVLKELKVKIGDKVAEGSVIAIIEAAGSAAALRRLRRRRWPPAPARAAAAPVAAAPASSGGGSVEVRVPTSAACGRHRGVV